MNQIVPRNGNGHVENALMRGDISKMNEAERVQYVTAVCHSLGLNPLTRPFDYITLNGRLTLYAKRDAADQLRKLHGISIEVVSQQLDGDLYTVHVRAKDKTGRADEDFGVVAIGKLQGEARANATLKAITKAKRRVTLSICGLGFLDETEVEDIPQARQNPHVTRPADVSPMTDAELRQAAGEDIPEGAPPEKRLLVKEQRPLFDEKLREMEATKTRGECKAWGEANADEVAKFKPDWQQMFRDRYKAHWLSLAPTESPTERAERILSGITDPGMLERAYDYEIEPILADLDKDQQEEVLGVYRKHEQRLAP